ncbi:MAG: carbon-nitrogen hydrolase family protein [Pseudorhodoplanes sp.]|uniref:carbon-nitrogen hydrolase family protein n=1 Tax=Pseudorhodoplanes sp. TaxID=1934341 RepID=UPI003D0FD976
MSDTPEPKFITATVQAAPAFLDLAAGVAKAQRLIAEAAAAGARLIAFPELWLPGYPWWIWLGPPAFGMQFMSRYAGNALHRDSDEMRALCETARRHHIHVVLGYAERAGGTLYIAQSLIGDDGTVLAHRRKLKPARTERTVFGQGDGADLAVVDTSIGRLGALSCGEHFQPLLKAAMFAQSEQIHVAAWPAFSLMRGRAFLNGPEAATMASQIYAIEGQCFVLCATTVNDSATLDIVCKTDEQRKLLTVDGLDAAGGRSNIFGPDGAPRGTYLPEGQEGLVLAEIDLAALHLAKTASDTFGHWSRPDVVRLMFNRQPAPPVVTVKDADA